MPGDLPFYQQEKPYSCAPACLRMVLAAYGIERSEEELRAQCRTELSGTTALNVLDAARHYGLDCRKYTLRWEQLAGIEADRLYPIVYVARGGAQHAVVVRAMTAEAVVLHDPLAEGLTSVTADAFRQEFLAGPRTVILLASQPLTP
jgi:ATP-binding cassette subfamily C protein